MACHRRLDHASADPGGRVRHHPGESERDEKSDDILVRRLLGAHRGWGQFIGLDDEWAARAIEAVGNYGEMFDRDLGAKSPMRLERGLNNLSTKGGLMYSNPIR